MLVEWIDDLITVLIFCDINWFHFIVNLCILFILISDLGMSTYREAYQIHSKKDSTLSSPVQWTLYNSNSHRESEIVWFIERFELWKVENSLVYLYRAKNIVRVLRRFSSYRVLNYGESTNIWYSLWRAR